MKIKFEKAVCSYDDTESHDVTIYMEDGTKQHYGIYSLCECPEDAIIGRSLIDGWDLINIAKLAYDAGKNGEEFILEEVKDE